MPDPACAGHACWPASCSGNIPTQLGVFTQMSDAGASLCLRFVNACAIVGVSSCFDWRTESKSKSKSRSTLSQTASDYVDFDNDFDAHFDQNDSSV
jgi:hypothetical protein